MRKVFIVAAASVAALLTVAGHAQAQATRVFVSGFGLDTNPCSLGEPCRTFQHAHDTVAAGGEVVALDAAGYGTLNITKSVTITAIGVAASITSTGDNGISINAGPSDVVTIRGLSLFWGSTISSPPQGAQGIAINSAGSVTVRDCWVSGFPQTGIRIFPNASLNVELRGVTADNNGAPPPFGAAGLSIQATGSGTLTVLVTDSFFVGNTGQGVAISGNTSTGIIKATLSNVVAKSNFSEGVIVTSTAGHTTPVVMVTGSKIVNNSFGVAGFAGGLPGGPNVQVFVDRTQIVGNSGNGWAAVNGGSVSSYGNNEVAGNDNDGLNGVVQISSQ